MDKLGKNAMDNFMLKKHAFQPADKNMKQKTFFACKDRSLDTKVLGIFKSNELGPKICL